MPAIFILVGYLFSQAIGATVHDMRQHRMLVEFEDGHKEVVTMIRDNIREDEAEKFEAEHWKEQMAMDTSQNEEEQDK